MSTITLTDSDNTGSTQSLQVNNAISITPISDIPKMVSNLVFSTIAEHFMSTITYTVLQNEDRQFYLDNILQCMLGEMIQQYYPKNVIIGPKWMYDSNDTGKMSRVKIYEIRGNMFLLPTKNKKGLVLIQIQRGVDLSTVSRYRNTYNITFICPNHNRLSLCFQKKYHKIVAKVQEKVNTNLIIDIADIYGGVQASWEIPKRKLESVFVEKGLKEGLLSCITSFRKEKTRLYYERIQEPWHYNILFYGKPGTGKNSLINALAVEFGMRVLNITNALAIMARQMNSAIVGSNNTSPMGTFTGYRNTIFLVDEIDTIFKNREVDDGETSPLFTEFLTFLDCLSDGNIMIATTNHLDRLDPALIRSGRFNRRVEMKYWTEETLQEALNYHQLTKEDLKDLYPEIMDVTTYVPSTVMDAVRQVQLRKIQ